MAKDKYTVHYTREDGIVVSKGFSSKRKADKVFKRWTHLFSKLGKVKLSTNGKN